MKLNPVVLLLDPALSPKGDTQALLLSLQTQGFETTQCSSIPQVIQQMRQTVHTTAQPSLMLLTGDAEANCTAANYVRTLYPDLGIVAVSEDNHDKSLIRLLQSGVDNICSRQASGALVAATLFRVLARMGQAGHTQPAPQVTSGEFWVLSDQDWVLTSPEGHRIPLTTGERAFIVTLLNAPDLRASHNELIAAINQAYDAAPDSDRRQSRLSVLVSRLRTKFDRYNTELPLKSVHRWGYMFSGLV